MRRRRRRRKRSGGTGLQLVQIVGLGVILLIILLFRDEVADNAGKFFGVMGSDDVQITLDDEDAGVPTDPANSSDAGSLQPD